MTGRFSAEVRRKFNANLAWWLWEQGSVSTVSLSAVPTDICYDATKEIQHDFDDIGLRRELVAGCLVEKGGGTVYFGHRSIQEFLVAERLAETDLLFKPQLGRGDLEKVLKLINAEIIDFLIERVLTAPNGRQAAAKWLKYLDGWLKTDAPLAAFDLFVQIARIVGLHESDTRRVPWYLWLSYFIENGGAKFRLENEKAALRLCNMMRRVMSGTREMQASALLMCARAFSRTPEARDKFGPLVIAAWLPRDHLKTAVQGALNTAARQIYYIRPTESLPLWVFLTCSRIWRDERREVQISVDLSMLEQRVTSDISMGFEPDRVADADGDVTPFSFAAQSYYQALVSLESKIPKRELEMLRRFFGDDRVRSRIRPLEVVEKRRTRFFDTPFHSNLPHLPLPR